MVNKFWTSLSTLLLTLATVQISFTANAQSTQTPSSNAQAPASTESGGAAEFDLNLAGIGSQSELQRYADEWRAARNKEGLTYATAVQTSQIKAKVGSNVYGDAFLKQILAWLAKGNSHYVLKVAPLPLTFEATFVCLSLPRYNPVNYVNPV